MNENTVIEGVLTLPVAIRRCGTGDRDSRLILADTKEPYRVPHCLEDAEGRNVAFLYRVATDQEMTTQTLAQTEARALYIEEAVNKWAEAKQMLEQLATLPGSSGGLTREWRDRIYSFLG